MRRGEEEGRMSILTCNMWENVYMSRPWKVSKEKQRRWWDSKIDLDLLCGYIQWRCLGERLFGVQKYKKKVINDGLIRMCKKSVLVSLKLTEKRSQKTWYLGRGPNRVPSVRKCRKLNLESAILLNVLYSYINQTILSLVLVTCNGVWIGESIYWIFTSRNYK
jgi:hypothetical protein